MLAIIEKTLTTAQLDQLKQFGHKMEHFGADFIVCDHAGEILLPSRTDGFSCDPQTLSSCAREILDIQNDQLCRFGTNSQIMAIGLKAGETIIAVALVDMSTNSSVNNVVDDTVLCEVIDSDGTGNNKYIEQMLVMFAESFEAATIAEEQIESISAELANTYEELVLLYKMTTNMKITHSDANYLQTACDSLRQLIDVEGIAILLDKDVNAARPLTMAAGAGVVSVGGSSTEGYEVLHTRLRMELDLGKEALLDSDMESTFKYDWPENIKSIIAVPLYSGQKIIGLMVATNRLNKDDFDSTDVKLFNSVATEFAVFIENGRLFTNLKSLFIGSLRALTNSIDAKDRYTRGHSERVAIISRWIAEEYAHIAGLDGEQIHTAYLAGLLHDIGKIGIPGMTLRKRGKLTDEEYARIKGHPSIGANILGDIQQMREIIPGVLTHHERYDGSGYPDGLKGEDIPLLGRIVMLADTFDAMTSKRSYRNALALDETINEIKNGLGVQFDPELGKIFINSDIDRLWQLLQDGGSEEARGNDFSNYGTQAVGALLR